jgi:hypothetical protein
VERHVAGEKECKGQAKAVLGVRVRDGGPGEPRIVKVRNDPHRQSTQRSASIRIDGTDAAEDLYYAVCSGTFQIQFPDAARRIADALRDRVRATNPDLVTRWPAPTGD